MEREKILDEYKVTLKSLVEKTKFCYSEDFYKLDEFEKQKYNKDKMTTEAHLSTLCELLWGKKIQLDNGLGSMFALGILSSMFNYGGGFGSSNGVDHIKKTLEDDVQAAEENKAE